MNRKRTIRLIIGILWKLVAVALLIVVATYVCSRVNAAFTNAAGLVVGLIGAIPAVISFLKGDLKKFKNKDED